PARGHPWRRADAVRQRRDTLGEQGLAQRVELVPRRRRFHAPLLEGRLLVEDRPPVVARGHEDLLAVGVARQAAQRVGEAGAGAVALPQAGDVEQQALARVRARATEPAYQVSTSGGSLERR